MIDIGALVPNLGLGLGAQLLMICYMTSKA